MKSPLVVKFKKEQKKKKARKSTDEYIDDEGGDDDDEGVVKRKPTGRQKKQKPQIEPDDVAEDSWNKNTSVSRFDASLPNFELLENARLTGVQRCTIFWKNLCSYIDRKMALIETHETESYVKLQRKMLLSESECGFITHAATLIDVIETCVRNEHRNNETMHKLRLSCEKVRHNTRMFDVAVVTSMRAALPIIKWFENVVDIKSQMLNDENIGSLFKGAPNQNSGLIDKDTCDTINAEMLDMENNNDIDEKEGLFKLNSDHEMRVQDFFTQEFKQTVAEMKEEVARLRLIELKSKTFDVSCKYLASQLRSVHETTLKYIRKKVDRCDVLRTFLVNAKVNLDNTLSVYVEAVKPADKQHHLIVYTQ